MSSQLLQQLSSFSTQDSRQAYALSRLLWDPPGGDLAGADRHTESVLPQLRTIPQHQSISVRVPFVDFSNPARYGVRSLGRNFHINEKDSSSSSSTSGGPRLGVWHILPASVSDHLRRKQSSTGTHIPRASLSEEMEHLLEEGSQAVMLYLHGNTLDRTAPHCCELYNVLSEMDFHVLAVDYRGYGDSAGYPDEKGVVEDALELYHYARRVAPSKPIYMWGHSMGTGVAVQVVAKLHETNEHSLDALILEAPFNNMRDVVNAHPLSWPWRHYPFFNLLFVEPLLRSGLEMNSEEHIARIKCPVLVMHSADDYIIPVELGRRLVERARDALGAEKVTYVEFDKERYFFHNHIPLAKELPRVVEEFLQSTTRYLSPRNLSAGRVHFIQGPN